VEGITLAAAYAMQVGDLADRTCTLNLGPSNPVVAEITRQAPRSTTKIGNATKLVVARRHCALLWSGLRTSAVPHVITV
jgi:hypothetical protein